MSTVITRLALESARIFAGQVMAAAAPGQRSLGTGIWKRGDAVAMATLFVLESQNMPQVCVDY